MSFLQAIAVEEGFYTFGSRPQRNCNPGDIEFGRFSVAHGSKPNGDPRFAVFPDAATGFSAMRALFKGPTYAHKTISGAIATWAPSVENNVSAYVANVCRWTGFRADTVIDSLLDKPNAPVGEESAG